MAKGSNVPVEQIDEFRWRIPRSCRADMRVDGVVYSSQAMIADVIAGGGLDQVANVATLPGIVGNSLAMPDIHWGYGFCIGGVAATDISAGGVVSPGGVGYDINCGVRLLRTDMARRDVAPRIEALAAWLFRDVPSGVGVGGPYKFDAKDIRRILTDGCAFLERKGLAGREDIEVTESGGCLEGADADMVSDRAIKRGNDQCGTLGSGNHFAEVQFVEKVHDAEAASAFGLAEGMVTIMIHSGSRGLGYQVCDDYLKQLRTCPARYGIELPDRQLVCAPFDSPEARRYVAAMRAAANFAWANRQLLAREIRHSFARFFDESPENLGITQVYDVGHNMAKVETHIVDGQEKKLCVHRKGATRAFPAGHGDVPEKYRSTGQPVLIPGDMGTASWVLVGTGKAMEESFGSCCHGAGRVMSRHEAIRSAKGRRIDKELAVRGIYAKARGRTGLAEEQPEAYKDVDAVVQCVHAAGLARKVARLRPMAVVKGYRGGKFAKVCRVFHCELSLKKPTYNLYLSNS